jgi:hypothetical protein
VSAQEDDELMERAAKLLAYDCGDESDYCIDVCVTMGELRDRLTAMREEIKRKGSLLRQTLEAIRSGRSEPLFIMEDAIRNHLEDCAALTTDHKGTAP